MKTLFFLLFICNSLALAAQQKPTPEQLAQQQLDAYNKRDIEAFLAPYADSVAVYLFPDKLQYTGKHIMRQQYSDMFAQTLNLHCTLVKRMVIGNTVVDQESVVFEKDRPPLEAIAIYTIENNKISKVYFITPPPAR